MKRYGFEVVAAVLVFVTVGLSVLFRGDDLLFLGVALFAGLFVFAVARRSKTDVRARKRPSRGLRALPVEP